VLYVHIKRVLKISYKTRVMHASLYYSRILPVNINYISLLVCPWTTIFPWTSIFIFYFHPDEYQYIVNFTIKIIIKVKICKVQKSFTLQNHGGDSKIVWCAHNLNRIFKIKIKIKNWNLKYHNFKITIIHIPTDWRLSSAIVINFGFFFIISSTIN